MKDLYEILEINKNSNEGEIKKAYRKKAIKTHPDKGGSEKEFKKITEAYSILSDKNKRKEYDLYGYDYVNKNFNESNISPFEMFNEFFSGFNSYKKKECTVHKLYISIDEIYSGVIKNITINRDIKCTGCNGLGYINEGITTCKACGGNKFKVMTKELIPGMFQQITAPCNDCSMKGYTIKSGFECKKCNSTGIISNKDNYKINIKKGSKEGTEISLKDKGSYNINKKEYNDLIIKLQEIKNDNFIRKSNDIYTNQTITLDKALCGCIYPLQFLNNQILYLNINKIIKPDILIKVKGYGMPEKTENTTLYGDLIINFKILFPNKITSKQKDDFKKLFKHEEIDDYSKEMLVDIDYYTHSSFDMDENEDLEKSDLENNVQCVHQ